MNIQTKFDIGQKVWRIKKFGYKQWKVFRRHAPIITGLLIIPDTDMEYYLVGTKQQYSKWFDKTEIATTRPQAQAECDRRNK